MPIEGIRFLEVNEMTGADIFIGHGEHEPIDVVEDEALGRLALQHIELMTKNENFSVQRSARPEQPGHKAPNQPTDIAHNIEYHPIRRRSSAIWVCGRDRAEERFRVRLGAQERNNPPTTLKTGLCLNSTNRA
jgi:hypothetical protein